ncbi:MAG: hypothetical protein BHW42_01500 [Oscillibacter sp. CAG:241_62_21]|nr:MAG: hypothetical protein BHW42_01500 [Oscillibacter sp. CAG:241_62_21]
MENTLTLYVRYLAKPGCRETFLRQLTTHGVIDAIRREDGYLRYDYFLSVQNADEILLVEQWQTEEKQQAHLRAPHMDQLRRLKSEYVADAQLGRVHLD